MVSCNSYIKFFSYVLLDEESYEINLQKLLKASGQEYFNKVLSTHKRPFVLYPNQENSTIKEVVEVCEVELKEFKKLYFNAWANHIRNPLYYYSIPIREIITKDLQAQTTLLSIDTTPSLFTELSILLHNFDTLSQTLNKPTATPMLSQVLAWFIQKY
jgi:hypothetical protein